MSRQRGRQRHPSRRYKPKNANPSIPAGRSTTDHHFVLFFKKLIRTAIQGKLVKVFYYMCEQESSREHLEQLWNDYLLVWTTCTHQSRHRCLDCFGHHTSATLF